MRILFACVLIGSAFLSGCYYDSKENLYPTLNAACTDTVNVTYTTKIAPILSSYCVTCHNSSSPGGGIRLDVYSGVKALVDNGKLLGSIKQDGTASAMPKGGGKFDACKIAAFSIWIQKGALNN